MTVRLNDQERGGWVINWHTATDGRPGAVRHYLTAIGDPDAALEAVRQAIGGEPLLSLGSPVNRALLERRKLAQGDVVAVRTRRGPSLGEKGPITRGARVRTADSRPGT
jgi:hypothetical protein